MAIDFGLLLPPATRIRLARTSNTVDRLYRLPNRWLAEELLRLARRMRQDHPDKLGNPATFAYDADYVWHLVPEIAKRLGASNLKPNEATRPDIITLQGQDFRECSSCFLANISRHWLRTAGAEDTPTAADILAHDIANGNPVAIALDRLYVAPPAGHDRNDYVAWHIREISRNRGHNETPYWSPDLQTPARRHRLGSRPPASRPDDVQP